METFLKQVAARILDEHPSDTAHVLVVFNNHRSELFLRRAFESLSVESGRTFFLPGMTVIDDLVARLGGMKIVPNEFLLFKLYQIHIELGGEDRKYKTFEDFIAFGDLMLGDFSEVDRYCVDAHALFLNLHDLKAIDHWDVEDPSLSPFEQQYIDFYHSLHKYYSRLREELEAAGEAYSGMAYRHVAEHIESLAANDSHAHVYFVGFNAISECERRIIGEYVQRGKGTLLTDADTYYYADPMQEAGHFLRKHSGQFPSIVPRPPSNFAVGEKKITIVECPEPVLQCKYAGKLLAEHDDWLHDPESTAVVLADEKMLIPTLNSLPDSGEDYSVNISMGFAYADSNVHILMERLLSLYRRANDKGYYHADVLDVLSDYHISHLVGKQDIRAEATSYFTKNELIRCTAGDIATLVGDQRLLDLFPPTPPSPFEALALMRRVAEILANAGTTENNRKERQALGGLVEILDFFGQLKDYGQFIGNITTLEKIYSRIARRHNIAFLGQPLSGLQILGMLETRNLDFKRVILLSANEGVLPTGNKQNTLIPYLLQQAFGLPTFDEKDAVYAYNFYRLLQRAEEVYIAFSPATEGINRGEESRFVKQVRSELSTRFPGHIKVSDVVIDTDFHLSGRDVSLAGQKTAQTVQRLHDISASGFAPTSLTDFVECPLKYYYKRVLNVNEADMLDDDLNASQLGSCVHAVLEKIYTPFINKPVRAEQLRQALDNLTETIGQTFDEYHRNGRPTEGRNSFMRSVAESQLRHMLQKEIAVVEHNRVEIIALEQKIVHPLQSVTATYEVNIKGTVDRIDRLNGQLRIIDYKTGSLDPKEINVESGKLEPSNMPAKWLQLMCYALLYCREHHLNEPFTVGIYPLRNLQSGVQLAHWDKREELQPTDLDTFEDMLTATIDSLLDPCTPFEATSKGCNHCPIKTFCPHSKA